MLVCVNPGGKTRISDLFIEVSDNFESSTPVDADTNPTNGCRSVEKVGFRIDQDIRDSDTTVNILLQQGYIDVGDGCWRRNVLATTLRC